MNTKNTHTETERMRLAENIRRIADPKTKVFSANDAKEIFDALIDMPRQGITMTISGTINRSSDSSATNTGAPMQGNEGDKFNKQYGADKSYRCGTYVIRKKCKNSLDVRHVADVMADNNKGEVLRILRKNRKKYKLQLNKPLHINLWFFRLVLSGDFTDWKRSI